MKSYQFLFNENLTLTAKGLLMTILNNPTNEDGVSLRWMVIQSSDTQEETTVAVQELLNQGYIVHKAVRHPDPKRLELSWVYAPTLKATSGIGEA